eukprot:1457276-Prymnesium_polylepis.2
MPTTFEILTIILESCVDLACAAFVRAFVSTVVSSATLRPLVASLASETSMDVLKDTGAKGGGDRGGGGGLGGGSVGGGDEEEL